MTRPQAPAKGVALITGTSTGTGLATAIEAARAGWTTVATMRDLGRADALRAAADAAGVVLDVRRLDVTDAADIEREVAYCIVAYGRLDVLVNNAGSAAVGTVEMLGLEAFRSAMEVNFFGVVALTRAALPHLRESGGRVITISSVGGIVGQPFNEAYCAAKFAVEGFLESLQPVAKTLGVGVHVIEPGAVSSNFVENAGIDVDSLLASAGSYGPAISAYLARTSTQFASSNAQQPADVAAVVLAAMEEENPDFRIQTSAWAHDFVATKLADLDGSRVTGLTAGWVASN